MLKFFRKVLLFSIPFLIWFFVIFLVDPYDYWGYSLFKDNLQKHEIGKSEDSGRRQEFIGFKKNPRRNLVISDSQLQHVDFGEKWAHLSAPGSGIEDEIFILKKMIEYSPIDTVLFGVNPFEFVSKVNSQPLPITKSAFKIIDAPYFYFFDRCVYSSTTRFLMKRIKGDNTVEKDTPNMSKEDFWKQQLLLGKQHLEKRSDPRLRESQLVEIADIISKNNITLLIVIPIAHTDLYKMYGEYVEGEFLSMLKKYFNVIFDFYYPNDFTENKENFGDPFHANNDNQIYVNSILHKDTTYCRIYSK